MCTEPLRLVWEKGPTWPNGLLFIRFARDLFPITPSDLAEQCRPRNIMKQKQAGSSGFIHLSGHEWDRRGQNEYLIFNFQESMAKRGSWPFTTRSSAEGRRSNPSREWQRFSLLYWKIKFNLDFMPGPRKLKIFAVLNKRI